MVITIKDARGTIVPQASEKNSFTRFNKINTPAQ